WDIPAAVDLLQLGHEAFGGAGAQPEGLVDGQARDPGDPAADLEDRQSVAPCEGDLAVDEQGLELALPGSAQRSQSIPGPAAADRRDRDAGLDRLRNRERRAPRVAAEHPALHRRAPDPDLEVEFRQLDLSRNRSSIREGGRPGFGG